MHLSAVETFLLLSPGCGRSLCFALLPLIGRTAFPAALDNLWRSLQACCRWRVAVAATSYTVLSAVRVVWHAHFAVACNYVSQISPLHSRIGPSPSVFSWEGLETSYVLFCLYFTTSSWWHQILLKCIGYKGHKVEDLIACGASRSQTQVFSRNSFGHCCNPESCTCRTNEMRRPTFSWHSNCMNQKH